MTKWKQLLGVRVYLLVFGLCHIGNGGRYIAKVLETVFNEEYILYPSDLKHFGSCRAGKA